MKVSCQIFLFFCILTSCVGEPIVQGGIDIDGELVKMRYGEYGYAFKRIYDLLDTSYVYLDKYDKNWKEFGTRYVKKMKDVSSPEEFGDVMQMFMDEMNDPLIALRIGNRTYTGKHVKPKDVCNTYYIQDFETYGSIDFVDKEGLMVNHLYRKDAEGNRSGNYIFISFSGTFVVKSPDEINEFLSSLVLDDASGFIIDLRGQSSVNGIQALDFCLTFVSEFYPATEHDYYCRSVKSIEKLQLRGKNTITDRYPIAIIVNEETLGLKSIIAYALASLDNVKTISCSHSGGYGAICREYLVATLDKNIPVSLRYPAIDIGNWKTESFYPPLLPDYHVEWEGNSVINRYDKCVETAIDVICHCWVKN